MNKRLTSILWHKTTIAIIYILVFLLAISKETSAATYRIKKDNSQLKNAVYVTENNLFKNSILDGQSQFYWMLGQKNATIKLCIFSKESPSFSFQLLSQKGVPLPTKSYEFIPSKKSILAHFVFQRNQRYLLIIKNLNAKKTPYTISYTVQSRVKAKNVSSKSKKKKKQIAKPKKKITKQKHTISKPKKTVVKTKHTVSKPKKSKVKIIKLSLNKTFLKTTIGKSFSLSPSTFPKGAQKPKYIWTIANSSFLVREGSSFYAKKPGVTSVSCSLLNHPAITASCTIKITK